MGCLGASIGKVVVTTTRLTRTRSCKFQVLRDRRRQQPLLKSVGGSSISEGMSAKMSARSPKDRGPQRILITRKLPAGKCNVARAQPLIWWVIGVRVGLRRQAVHSVSFFVNYPLATGNPAVQLLRTPVARLVRVVLLAPVGALFGHGEGPA
jgi:hypothetical protein